jgi:hypothetical protein
MTETARRLTLATDQLVDLDDARGTVIRVASGRVWLTQYGDLADHVLGAGDAWAVERNGRTIVQAQESTTIDLSGPAADRAITPVASTVEPARVSDWISRVANSWIARRWMPYY